MKVSFIIRLKFAWRAFWLKPFKHEFPYQYHCDLRPGAGECDNNRRKSNCDNEGKVALANPSFELKFNECEHFYHVCQPCADRYIGTIDGEPYDK